ncbi:STAS domain-containing protein [Citroniella saccharovorans]|uniref:Anti-sigma factor antagonist n=1 Tax=Citroniella saccharovorans TaxID=2053367 RepID=A0AAW9MS23_9FIRM|nr:STAS domain-containing protein [Citroniella saccharovorans]MEB3428703.1 STAS domain-containing protein [Citroniella saccharovorans]
MALDIIFEEDDKLVVKLKGDLDIYSSTNFSDKLLEKYNENKKDVIVDLTDLDYIDSTGLGAFISLYKNIEKENDFKIINPKKSVKKIFVITELDKIFKLED